MIPKPVICMRCKGFTGEHRMTDNEQVWGYHELPEECLEVLTNNIKSLEERVARLEERNSYTHKKIITKFLNGDEK